MLVDPSFKHELNGPASFCAVLTYGWSSKATFAVRNIYTACVTGALQLHISYLGRSIVRALPGAVNSGLKPVFDDIYNKMFSKISEPIKLCRDCFAIAVPEGVEVRLPKGTVGSLAQALGDNYTVYVRGRMFRIAAEDADAIGKKPPPTVSELPLDMADKDIETLVWEQMKTCFDPEIPVNIVDLGLIYDCTIRQQEDNFHVIFIKMTLTEPSCGMGPILASDVKNKLELLPTVTEAQVELVFEPPWTKDRMSDLARLQTGLY